MDVTVYGELRAATGEKTVTVDFDGGTVQEAVETFVAAYPRAERHLLRDDGGLERSIRVACDGETAEMDVRCPPDAELTIHPPMRGG